MSNRGTTRLGIAEGAELLLWLATALSFGALLFSILVSFRAHALAAQVLTYPAQASTPKITEPQHASQPLAAGEVMGRLEIPDLQLSVPVTAGIESSSLLRGVGHIDGTAMPGGLGTLGLAGHRDTYFRSLRRIHAGMDIRVTDQSGTFHYAVDTTEIVLPEQVEVLAIGTRPELTLVTCYPFDYIGPAPKRFIVHAHLLSASPDARRLGF